MQHETLEALKENIDCFNSMKIKSMHVKQKKYFFKDKEKIQKRRLSIIAMKGRGLVFIIYKKTFEINMKMINT